MKLKHFKRKNLTALILAICLTFVNMNLVFASSETTPAPTTAMLNQEITQTAEYVKSTVKLDASADFYSTSKILILLLRSGVDCSDLVNSYLTQVSATYVNNNQFTFSEPITDYAYFSIILGLSGIDATHYHGVNIIENLENLLSTATQTTINEINPYKLPNLYQAVYAYAKNFKDSTLSLSKIKTAILNYSNENGINYWGNSADNNGFVLSGLSMLYTADAGFTNLVNGALTFSQTLLTNNGASAGDFMWSTQPNSDSTAASLILYSTYGYQELAAKSYAGLLTFKNTTVSGAYSYTDSTATSSIYSTIDALFAMLSYKAVLTNQPAPYTVTDFLDKLNATPLPNTGSQQETTAENSTQSNQEVTSDNNLISESSSEVGAESNSSINSTISGDSSSPKTADSGNINLILLVFLLSTVCLISTALPFIKPRFNKYL